MPAHFVIRKTASTAELAALLAPKVDNLGKAMGRRAQRIVPKRTWALHDTITVETTTSGAVITTRMTAGSAEVDYWNFVERGTSRMAAQPYLRPAFLQSRSADLNTSGAGPSRHGVREYVTYTNKAGKKSRITKAQAANYNRKKKRG